MAKEKKKEKENRTDFRLLCVHVLNELSYNPTFCVNVVLRGRKKGKMAIYDNGAEGRQFL